MADLLVVRCGDETADPMIRSGRKAGVGVSMMPAQLTLQKELNMGPLLGGDPAAIAKQVGERNSFLCRPGRASFGEPIGVNDIGL